MQWVPEAAGRRRNRSQTLSYVRILHFSDHPHGYFLGTDNTLGHILADSKVGALPFDQAKAVWCGGVTQEYTHWSRD